MAEGAALVSGARASDRPARAMLLVFLAMAFMTLQDAIIKWLSGHLPVIEILFIRSLIMLPLILAAATATGQLGRFRTRRYGAHLLRVVLTFWPSSHFSGRCG